ncbi:MAG: DUF1559 domain-containing protein [Armatimonadetes bacterium]|nr:DUF1559 domain-containing protein [Armatimonadota bacterium]
MPRRLRWGFTLIELLVVIAIIALLAGILFPVFAKARATAEKAACTSNLKQLALACLTYAEDYDQKLPGVWDAPAGTGRIGGWMFYQSFGTQQPGDFDPSRGSLYPYVKNAQIFNCPEDTVEQGDSYALNSDVCNPVAGLGGANFHAGTRLTRMRFPSATLLLCEEDAGPEHTTNDGYQNAQVDKYADRHQDGAVFCFCDGHVKWSRVSAEAVRDGQSDWRAAP